jgi:hypothetical protein
VINFRYHVVSIVAVFLALAVGLVLGATELQGTTIDTLNHTTKYLSNSLSAAQVQNRQLQQQVNTDQAFAQADEARLLDGLLPDQRVVVVTAAGASASVVNGITSAVHEAGASVTGQVNLQPKLMDTSQDNQQFLSQLVQQLVAPATPPGGTALQQFSQLLGTAILTKDNPSGTTSGSTSGGSSGDAPTVRQGVLSGYAQAGLISVSGALSSTQSAVPATLAVVVIPATPPSGGVADPANQGLITLAQELNSAGLGTVMIGSVSGSGSGSAIDALRTSSAAGQISTVDYADTMIGQIVTVQALQQALTGHKANSYGEDAGSNAASPDPAPTPAASTTASTTTTGSRNGRGSTDPSKSTKGGRS